jgi:hypothetical protein
MNTDNKLVIEQTVNWIKKVVIDCNFCPFASKPFMQKSIRYSVQESINASDSLIVLKEELEFLDKENSIETSFIIFQNDFKSFDDYLDLIEDAEDLLSQLGYDGIYQIASFHPDYCFADSDEDDPANYTNRSIYPMLHLLREDSITKALTLYKETETIPENNMAFTREKGLKYMQLLRAACL